MRPADVSPEERRWHLMLALDASRPIAASERILKRVLDGGELPVTALDVRRDLDFLEIVGLITIDKSNPNLWLSKPTLAGIIFSHGEGPEVPEIDRMREGL